MPFIRPAAFASRLRQMAGGAFGPRYADWSSPDFWIALVFAGAIAFRVYYLAHSLEWVVAMFVADDFFYYANTAWNIAQGYGSSCDQGLTTHNGFHPLYLVLLLVPAGLGLSKAGLVYTGIVILNLATLAAILVSYRIGTRLGARWAALAVPLALAFNIYFVRMSFHGFETALVLVFVLATMLSCVARRPAWLTGIWLGLACLARIDTVVLALPVCLCFLAQKRMRDIPITGVVTLLMLSPWLIWSLSVFGSALPLSGAAKLIGFSIQNVWTGLEIAARGLVYQLAGNGMRDFMPPQLVYAAGILMVAAALKDWRRTGWMTVYFLLTLVIYAGMTNPRHEHQFIRYLVPSMVLLIVVTSTRWPRSRAVVPVLVALLIVSANSRFVRWAHDVPVLPTFVSLGQTRVPEILDEIATDDDVVGCFDSGSISYFARRPVVNLDGLVNFEVVRMLREGAGPGWNVRYMEYLREKGITILVGGTAFYWPNYFPELDEWESLHPPLDHSNPLGQIVFLRVPARSAGE